jgi:hypothetical protein
LFKKSLFSFLWLLVIVVEVKAASCCGGGFAVPLLITGDDKAQVTTTLSSAQIDTDVFADGVWRRRDARDETRLLKIEAARIFKDRFQYGFAIPVQWRHRDDIQDGDSSGLGDISAQMGYEYLPDWDYSYWRPRGVGFLTLTAPTGRSIYDSEIMTGMETQGRGFWSVGAGTALTKAWTVWDMNSIFEIHRAFEKSVHNSQLDGTVTPGWGGTASIGAGYSIRDFRFGGALAWAYEDAIVVRGNNSSDGSVQRWATGTLIASYLSNDHWAGSLSYSDQTLFGDPLNANLSKALAITLQKKWER